MRPSPLTIGLLAFLWFFFGGLGAFVAAWSLEGDNPTGPQVQAGNIVYSAYLVVLVALIIWWCALVWQRWRTRRR